MASSFFGEPRATADADIAIRVNADSGESFLERALAEFYVLTEPARAAIRTHQSFNLLADPSGYKADLFVLGDSLLDRRQLERRVLIPMPDSPTGLWVTSPEDQVLRKLDWFRMGGSVSDRQWRDVVGIILVRGNALDVGYLRERRSSSISSLSSTKHSPTPRRRSSRPGVQPVRSRFQQGLAKGEHLKPNAPHWNRAAQHRSSEGATNDQRVASDSAYRRDFS